MGFSDEKSSIIHVYSEDNIVNLKSDNFPKTFCEEEKRIFLMIIPLI